jgi:hypothetical protein
MEDDEIDDGGDDDLGVLMLQGMWPRDWAPKCGKIKRSHEKSHAF